MAGKHKPGKQPAGKSQARPGKPPARNAGTGARPVTDPKAAAAAVSAAKTQASSGGIFVGSQAIQLHGGIGVTEELNISHYYRRLYVIARQFGDVELHLARFAEAVDRAA